MQFLVHAVQIARKRDKKQQRCNQYGKEYDDWVVKIHKNETGCNNPYQEQDRSMPVCNTKEQMIRSMFDYTVVTRQKYTKPCKTMENVRWEYLEYVYPNNKKQVVTTRNKLGGFWFGIDFHLSTFKEVTQIR